MAGAGDLPTGPSEVPTGALGSLIRGSIGHPLLPLVLLLAGVVAFAGAWTWIGWLRFESLHLYVLDFGYIYQQIWATAHGQSPALIGSGAVQPMLFLLVPFVSLFPSQSSFFLFLLGLNSGAVALAALPVYLLVRDRFGNPWLALGLGLAYLAFPAVAGSVWFPIHFESFFPLFFLTGYWLYRRDRLRLAGVVWTAAILTNIGAPIMVAFFGLGLLLEPYIPGILRRLRSRNRTSEGGPTWRTPRAFLALYLIGASAGVFLAISAYLASFEGVGGVLQFLLQTHRVGSSSGGSPPLLSLVGRQLMTAFLLLVPLLGLPLLGREERWMLLPFAAHAAFLGSPTAFLWPFTDQYFCYAVPALFAGAIRGLERPWKYPLFYRRIRGSDPSTAHIRWSQLRSPAARWGLRTIVAVVLAGIVFAPWGPANPALAAVDGLAQGSFDYPAATTADPGSVASLRALLAITPASGNLLVQNNLVEPLDRMHYVIPGFHTAGQPISYVLTDPYDSTFYSPNYYGPQPVSMLRWADYYLAGGATVLGEADGALLLSVNHSSPPMLYRPLTQYLAAGAFPCCGDQRLSNVTSPALLATGPRLPFLGNYSVWSPGNFTINVILGLTAPAMTNLVTLGVSYDGGLSSIANLGAATASSSSGGSVIESFTISIPVYLPGPQLTLTVQHWTGTVQFEGLWINQTAPI